MHINTMEEIKWSKVNNKGVFQGDYQLKTADKQSANLTFHHHDYYEIYLIVKGNSVFITEGRSNYVTEGDVILISPNEIHNFDDSASDDFYCYTLSLSAKYLSKLSTSSTDLTACFKKASALHKNIVKTDTKYFKRVNTLMQLIENVNRLTYGGDIMANTHVSTLLIAVNRLALETIDDSQTEITLIDKIVTYIENNVKDELKIETIADEFGLSPFRLSHFFKDETKMTVHQYVLQKRLALSKTYLSNGVSVKEVAALCGFNDVSNFFRAFKSAFNATPKEYFKMTKE